MRRGRDIAPGRRAFYRRFEDEILGYFLARGATPEVAADLTAESFAAALPSQSWRRLAGRAHDALDASREEGRVVADARRRSGMAPLVLTNDSLARIAAVGSRSISAPREIRFEDGDDVRARVIDESDSEQAAAHLRLSDAVVCGPMTEPEPDHGDAPRVPELEAALVAAVPPRGTRPRAAVALMLASAVAVLGFLVLAHGSSDDQGVSRAAAAQAFARSSRQEIIRVGNTWAKAFAASGSKSCVLDMTHTACERHVPLAVRQSFRGSTVQEVTVRGRRAAARFSNNEIVEFVDGGPHSPWQVHVVGRDSGLRLQRELAPEEQVARDGNSWARLFASTDQPRCNRYMTQPACERTPARTIAFRHSFRDTIVRDVVVEGRRAAAMFSNGELVDFHHVEEDGGAWWVAKLGRNAGRLYQEREIVRSGNAWARFFAATTRHCVDQMTPRACAQVLPARFKRSFRNATIDAVLVIRGHRATARFSNGELVEFRYVADAGGRWWIDKLGPGAGRGSLPE